MVENQELTLLWLYSMTILRKMKMMSIMRDIYAEIPGYDKYKINALHTHLGTRVVETNTK